MASSVTSPEPRRLQWLLSSPELKEIEQKIGVEKWQELVRIFTRIPLDYAGHNRRYRDVIALQKRIVKKCRELSKLLSTYNTSNWYFDLESSPLHGMVIEELFDKYWLSIIESMRFAYRNGEIALDILRRHFVGLFLLDPSPLLFRLLDKYANAIESEKMDTRSKALFQFTYGKLTLKEFTKRVVFFFLQYYWPPKKRAPNKEAALIVNGILGLSGKKMVTANDITQMNKQNRRRYHRE